MKKIISIIFVLAMLFVCTVPAMASDFRGDQTISEDRSCDGFLIDDNTNVIINSEAKICAPSVFTIGKNSTITIGSKGMLTGDGVIFAASNDTKIIIEDGGVINLSFLEQSYAEDFASLLGKNGIRCRRVENNIMAPCPHASTSPVTAFVCDDCGELIAADTHTGSMLSAGYPGILYGIGGLAIGFLAAMFIFRKKKAAVSGADSAEK